MHRFIGILGMIPLRKAAVFARSAADRPIVLPLFFVLLAMAPSTRFHVLGVYRG
jgi:hypothetical protein